MFKHTTALMPATRSVLAATGAVLAIGLLAATSAQALYISFDPTAAARYGLRFSFDGDALNVSRGTGQVSSRAASVLEGRRIGFSINRLRDERPRPQLGGPVFENKLVRRVMRVGNFELVDLGKLRTVLPEGAGRPLPGGGGTVSQPVPEPSAALLFGAGLFAAAASSRRRES